MSSITSHPLRSAKSHLLHPLPLTPRERPPPLAKVFFTQTVPSSGKRRRLSSSEEPLVSPNACFANPALLAESESMHPESSLESQGIDVPYMKRIRVGEPAAGYVLPLKQDVNPLNYSLRMASSYRTLQDLELLPLPYPDLATVDTTHMSRGMEPLSESQITVLGHLSFTASADPDLLPDLLLALDEDLSRSTAFSDRYAKYHDAVKDKYDFLLSVYSNVYDRGDDGLSHHWNGFPLPPISDSTPDKLSQVLIEHASRVVLDFIPECRLQYRIREACPGLHIIPSATLSLPNRPPTALELSVVVNKGENPLRFYRAATGLVERLNSVGSVQLDHPHTVANNHDNWWLLLNKGALYLTDVDPAGANILLYYSCNAFLVLWRQQDHIFVSDVKGNFRGNSLEEQFRTVSDAGLRCARAVFPEPDGGYRPYPRIHDVYLALTIVAALAVNPSYAVQFPSLEAFRTRRRTPSPVKPSSVYDMDGGDIELSESDGGTLASSLVTRFNQLHGCTSGTVRANLFWGDHVSQDCKFVCLAPTLVGRDIVVQSEIRSSVDACTYLVNVRGFETRRKLVLKVFLFEAYGQAEFGAYMALEALQGSIIPACYGFGYLSDQPWILLEYINPPPSYLSFSDLRQISRAHR
ncbi:hypothetical protein EDD85DRAFT_201333 [Armillaria nabsnona]|nr:hypothetical protein EDD85DRAFT_201333 [Armillaria nabsnona]